MSQAWSRERRKRDDWRRSHSRSPARRSHSPTSHSRSPLQRHSRSHSRSPQRRPTHHRDSPPRRADDLRALISRKSQLEANRKANRETQRDHQREQQPQPVLRLSKPCHFFGTTAGCRRGAACGFQHGTSGQQLQPKHPQRPQQLQQPPPQPPPPPPPQPHHRPPQSNATELVPGESWQPGGRGVPTTARPTASESEPGHGFRVQPGRGEPLDERLSEPRLSEPRLLLPTARAARLDAHAPERSCAPSLLGTSATHQASSHFELRMPRSQPWPASPP